MRGARFSRRDALYDASISVETLVAAEQAILNHIDIEGIIDVDIAVSTGVIKYPAPKGEVGFYRRCRIARARLTFGRK